MTENPLNLILLLLVITTYGGLACLLQSPEALDRLARRFRARSRAMIAGRRAYTIAYCRSLEEDARAAEARELIEELEKR